MDIREVLTAVKAEDVGYTLFLYNDSSGWIEKWDATIDDYNTVFGFDSIEELMDILKK
jgi:hypothetical protein